MRNFDIVIIGAGIIGLAAAFRLLKKSPGLKVCILEKESIFAAHQTGRNSGVIHSGIYYKPGSSKALNCINGYKLLLEFCNEYNVSYEICGKLIIAVSENEINGLNILYERGTENGLTGLSVISENEIKKYEPHAAGLKALHVPQTGIVNYKTVCEKIYAELLKEKVCINFNERVTEIKCSSDEVSVKTQSETYSAGCLVSCAGLYSDRISELSGMKTDFKIIPFRGEYYRLRDESRRLVKNLIYPVPDPEFPFLGVHFTRRTDGITEAGPNAVLAFGRESYKKSDINFRESAEILKYSGFRKIAAKYFKTGFYEFYRSFSKKEFVRSLQKLIPEITADDLIPGGSGVRAQACSSDGTLIDDFLFAENEHIINVCNAPSPAATSAFSIGDTISEKIISKLK